MKKLSLLFIVLAMAITSCGDKKSKDASVEAMGQRLFKDKTCITCHAVDDKVIGPSIKEMVKVYDEKGGDFIAFLKGDADAIVDTNPGQVAIMKANLNSFVKDMSLKELESIEAYMRAAASK